jgi:hypothetical protein
LRTSNIGIIVCLLYHIEVASSSYLHTLDKNKLEGKHASITKEISEGDSPSLVNLVRAVSVSTENGRSWLPAFPRNCNKPKGRERNKKHNYQFFDESQNVLMYFVQPTTSTKVC